MLAVFLKQYRNRTHQLKNYRCQSSLIIKRCNIQSINPHSHESCLIKLDSTLYWTTYQGCLEPNQSHNQQFQHSKLHQAPKNTNTVSEEFVRIITNKLPCELSYTVQEPRHKILTVFFASDLFQVARNNAVNT